MSITRVLSAAVGLFLFFIVIILPSYVFGAAVFILSIIAVSEFNKAMINKGHRPYKAIPYTASLLIPFIVIKYELELDTILSIKYILIACAAILITSMVWFVMKYNSYSIIDISLSIFAGIFFIPLFSSLIVLRYLDHGIYHLLIAFAGAWLTDTFAYFVGRAFGKKKLIPLVSPKKTWAGAIGGLIGTTSSIVLAGILLNKNIYADNVNIIAFIILGVLLSIFSQFGDLAASAIKRYSGIKDFGNLMPGHGGVIDRFDSVLFTSAITLAFVLILF